MFGDGKPGLIWSRGWFHAYIKLHCLDTVDFHLYKQTRTGSSRRVVSDNSTRIIRAGFTNGNHVSIENGVVHYKLISANEFKFQVINLKKLLWKWGPGFTCISLMNLNIVILIKKNS